MRLWTYALAPSVYLDPLPELESPGLEVAVHAGAYATWAAAFAANPFAHTFLTFDEDLRGMGEISVGLAQSGLPEQRRVIRYAGPNDDQPPAKRAGQTLIAGYTFGPGSGNPGRDFILHGLTLLEVANENQIRFGSTRIVIDQCLFESPQVAYGTRFLTYATYCTAQRCVFRRFITDPPFDGVAMQLRTPTLAQGTGPMPGHKFLDNQVLNFNDAFAITENGSDNQGIFAGIVVDGLEAETDATMYEPGGYGLTENAIDLKNGSDDPDDPVIISRVRAHGFRYYPGRSDGCAIVVQQYATNVTIRDSVGWDCPLFFRQENWPGGGAQTDRNVRLENCLAHDIRPFAAEDAGCAIRSRLPLTVADSVFSNVTVLRDNTDQPGFSWTMEGNKAIAVDSLGTAQTPWDADASNEVMDPDIAGARLVPIRRLSGTQETVVLEQSDPAGWSGAPAVHVERRCAVGRLKRT